MKKNGYKSGILRRAGLALMAGVLGIALYSWNARQVMRNQLPMPFGFGISVVLSGSMEPALQVDDLVVIGKAEDFQTGDVLVYQSGSSLVIHRLVAIEEAGLILKGDANNAPDDPVSPEQVKGRLILTIPGGGKAVGFLRQPWVAAALLALVILLTETGYQKEKEQDAQELEAIQAQIRQLLDEMDETK